MSKSWAIRKWVALLCVSGCIFAGCSVTRLFYDRIDVVIRWYLDDYVALNNAQKASFDVRLEALLSWHRTEELPLYVNILDDFLEMLDQGDPYTALQKISKSIEGAAMRIQARSVELLLATGADLDAAQFQQLSRVLISDHEELEADLLVRDEEEYRSDLKKRFKDQCYKYMGPLTKKQASLIQHAASSMVRLDRLWLVDREIWIKELSAILNARESDWMLKVRSLFSNLDEMEALEYREAVEQNMEVLLNLIAEVIDIRTDKQDLKLRKKLRSLKKDLEKLYVP